MKKILLLILVIILVVPVVSAAMMIIPDNIKSVYGHDLKFFADNTSNSSSYIDAEGKVCNIAGERDDSCERKQGVIKVYLSEDKSCDYLDFGSNNCPKEFYISQRCINKGEFIWDYLGQECCEGLELSSKQFVFSFDKIDLQVRCVEKINFFQKLFMSLGLMSRK